MQQLRRQRSLTAHFSNIVKRSWYEDRPDLPSRGSGGTFFSTMRKMFHPMVQEQVMCCGEDPIETSAMKGARSVGLKVEEVVVEAARSAGVVVLSAPVEALEARAAGEVRRWMSEAERTRHERYALERLRRRDLITRALARGELGVLLGCAPESLEFEVGAHERPRLAYPSQPNFDFNLAHSEERVVLAAAQGVRVGVNIEHRT